MVNDYFPSTWGIKVDINILRARLDENYLFCTKQQTLFNAAKFSDVERPVSHAIWHLETQPMTCHQKNGRTDE